MMMTTDDHSQVVDTIQSIIIPNADARFLSTCLQALFEEFPSIEEETMRSIFAFEYERRMKHIHQDYINRGDELYERYLAIKGDNSMQREIALLPIALEIDLAPALLARIILDKHFERNPIQDGVNVTKDEITQMMKKPDLIMDARLSVEVETCLQHDDFYGPDADSIKQCMGDQFELYLHDAGAEVGVKFVEEEASRGVGFDKTPDLKLEYPVLVDGTPIHWIESKALFADEELHQSYVLEQYERYCARFGPGLVIYWYGFVETILYTTHVDVIISKDFPAEAISQIQTVDMDRLGKSVHPVPTT